MGVSKGLMLATALILSGCVLPGKFLGSEIAPTIQPASVVATWNPKVVYTPDPANGGKPSPGLAGRVYLFGPTPDCPLACDGSIAVEVYDDTPKNGQASSVLLEQWHFDPATLKRLQKKDMIGEGYTLFLPWGTYRTDIKQVHLQLRFEPAAGSPLFAPSGPMTIEHATPSAGPMPK